MAGSPGMALKSPHSSTGPLAARRERRTSSRRASSSRSRCRNAPHVPWYEQTVSPSNVWMAQSTPGMDDGPPTGFSIPVRQQTAHRSVRPGRSPSGGERETALRERGREGVQPVDRDLLQAGRVHAATDERVGQYGAFGLPAFRAAVQDVPLRYQHVPAFLDECRMICAVGCGRS